MRKGRILLASSLVGLTAVGVPWAVAEANHVAIQVMVPAPAPPEVVVVPGPPATTTYVVPAPVQTFKDIRAQEVRANTIYANRIEADEIQGVIHQTKGLKISNAHGDLRIPQVSASVLYADEISANQVVADHIYVRDLRRR